MRDLGVSEDGTHDGSSEVVQFLLIHLAAYASMVTWITQWLLALGVDEGRIDMWIAQSRVKGKRTFRKEEDTI